MNDDLLSLADSDFKSDLWSSLYLEKPKVATALHYLLLMEKHGGTDASGKLRNPKEVNEAVARELGYSAATLATKKREWTNDVDQPLAEARAFLQPIRAEADMILADVVRGKWGEIINRVLQEAIKPDNNIYAILAAAQFLKNEVITPANAKQVPSDTKDQDYYDRMEQAGIIETPDEEEAKNYIKRAGGG